MTSIISESQAQVIMKFELLPTEILLEVLKFLSLFDTFYSLNYLNDRFNQLLRSIPLHFNFQHISKSTFDQFCQLLRLNPEVQKQVYSLELSNKETCGQIQAFLSLFSLNEFSHLHSLTLVQLEKNNMPKLTSMLPFVSALHSCHFIDCDDIIFAGALPSSLRILSLPTLPSSMTVLSSITNLTISICSITQLLQQLFKYIPMLTYLNVHYITSSNHNWRTNYSQVTDHIAVHLQELIISNFDYPLRDFERLAKQTPNLINLEICGGWNTDMIDAKQWEYLLTTSLAHLTIFKFIFSCSHLNENNSMRDKFHQFQTDFWLVQHPWYTEYSLSNNFALIYTVPYMLDYYELQLDTHRYWNQLLNTFDKVNNLTLYHGTIEELCSYYFPNVTSLTILSSDHNHRPNLDVHTIVSLKTLINLANLTHFCISPQIRPEGPSVLLRILQESPKLSSMKINARFASESHYFDNDLLKHLKKKITTIDIYNYGYPSIKFRWDLDKFCQDFSNLEHLIITVIERNDLLFLLKYLPNLSKLKAYVLAIKDQTSFQHWFTKETCQFNLLFQLKCIHKHETELSIWIDRKIQ